MNKKVIGGVIGAGILVAGIALYPGKKQEETLEPLQNYSEDIIQPIKQSSLYEVQKGDYLSGIVRDELGLKGKNIYTTCLEIQKKNGFGPERDISKVVDGKLVSGQDGFADLIYPGERLNLY